MFRNYLKIAVRNLLKQKSTSFINIFGLAMGMAVVLLIGLWIWDELQYDRYHQNYRSIAQVWQHYSRETKLALAIQYRCRSARHSGMHMAASSNIS